ncbi:MAG: hypothetical protein J3Q66DRAFT_399427 [Benniella sp.]|nr:MAG: hypothetical protein J3Q66DRAFT_399427 [Benniella sp.]
MTLPSSNGGISSTLDSPLGPGRQSTGLHLGVASLTPITSLPPTTRTNLPIAKDNRAHHISAGLGSNGHLIRRLYLCNTGSLHIFDHPNVSQLTDITCILSSNVQSLMHAENIITRNIDHRLQRLKISQSPDGQQSGGYTSSQDIDSNGINGSLHDHPQIERGYRVSSFDTGSEARRPHSIRGSRRPQGSLSSRGPHRHRHFSADPYNLSSQQYPLDHNGKNQHRMRHRFDHTRDLRNPHDTLPRHKRSYAGSTFLAGSEKGTKAKDQDAGKSSHPGWHNDGTSVIMNSLYGNIHNQEVQPVLLTHLSLFRHEFVMEDWIEMMRMMPALLELELEIISVVPKLSRGNMSIRPDVSNAPDMVQVQGLAIDLSDDGAMRCNQGLQQPVATTRQGKDNPVHIRQRTHSTMSTTHPNDNSAEVNPNRRHRHRHRRRRYIYGQSNSRHDKHMPIEHDNSNTSRPPLDSGGIGHDVAGCINNRTDSDSEDSAVRSMRHQFDQQRLNGDHDVKTKAALPLHCQFPSVRSLIFRGPIILPELLEHLPNLESLALEDPPPNLCDTGAVWSGTSNTSESTERLRPSLFMDLANVVSYQCPRLCRLVLAESSAQNPQWLPQIPQLLQAIPQLLHFVASTRLVSQNQEIVATLLQYHGAHLRSFFVQDGTQALRPNGYPHHPQQAFFDPENNIFHPPLYHQPRDPQQVTLRRLCLKVLETCPNLQVFDCKISLPIEDVMTSIPDWACHCNLAVLRLELSEFTEAGTLGSEEEEVMEMFIKTLFLGARASSPPAAASMATEAMETGSDSSSPSLLSQPWTRSPSVSSSSTTTSTPPISTPSLESPDEKFQATSSSFHGGNSLYQQPQRFHQGQRLQGRQIDARQGAVGSFLSSFANCQVQAAGRLMALQFLVEYYLVAMPNLDRFILGSKTYGLPPRPG